MPNDLHSALRAMMIEDDEPINLPDEPRFKVFEENSLSLLGRLLNPDCQSMSRMIDEMPTHWRVVGRVRGIALSREKFQFIFKREEDLQNVLNDRPWNISCNFYTLDTMHALAKAIGFVRKIAYDPKASQKTDFIRALVEFDVAKPAREEKVLNVSADKSVIISYEYEKLRKKCFPCFRLTHEKPQCPLLRKQHHQERSNQRTWRGGSSSGDHVRKDTQAKPQTQALLEGPSGFPPLFPELSKEEQKSALLYISHDDPTEKAARIARVKLHIEELKDKDGE
ncbi:uncharacterized protein At4g02000-like [Raphanus sativus]|uniref:Uncharacterized protein At4g02000-like n=1 Tax=Raphanus sativus TaxID=3726 RepID=A0A9W3D8J4_RAPSA|nr:uncharacterized protein At4g02000-like [Raphanus sativus]